MTYNEFIEKIISARGQWNIPKEEYWEGHHIIPRCLGGTGGRKKIHKNIIWLYPEEHFIAHKLLAEENPTNYSLVTAFRLMCATTRRSSKFTEKTQIDITPDDYALCRKLVNECPVPDSVRHKMSISATGKPHPKPNTENYGKWRMGRHLYVNLENNLKLFIADDEAIPDGYIIKTEITKFKKLEERAKRPDARHRPKTEAQKLEISKTMQAKKLQWWTNGVDEIRCKKSECPAGWILGRSEVKKQRMKENHTHTKFIGEKNGMYNKHHSTETKQKIAKFGLGRHWYNNGKIQIFEHSCPNGFILGRLKK